MEAFIVLMGIVLAWIVFATVQDLKTREIANWLTFSLIAVALAYRGFVAATSGAWNVWWWGIIGGAVFVVLAYALYYGRVFAGGDAKLLMGVGIALPYQSGSELALWGGAFLFLLFFFGALYTLVYSACLVVKNRRAFRNAFLRELGKQRWLFVFSVVLVGILAFIGIFLFSGNWRINLIGSILLLAIPLLYAYLQSVERACLIRLRKPEELREGDWLVRAVKVGARTISARVHGLFLDEIMLLRRSKKSVVIKEGVPFVPAFLFAYMAMVYAALTGTLDSFQLSSVLSSLAQVFSRA